MLSPRTTTSTERTPRARLEAAFVEHHAFVWRVARRLGVPEAHLDDAAQEVFLVFARRLEGVEESKERAFLYGTTRRLAADMRRSQRRKSEVPSDTVASEPADGRPSPEEVTEAQEERVALGRILDAMEDDVREVFVLSELEELGKAEVAVLVGVPEGTVASRLRRARAVFNASAERLQRAASSEDRRSRTDVGDASRRRVLSAALAALVPLDLARDPGPRPPSPSSTTFATKAFVGALAAVGLVAVFRAGTPPVDAPPSRAATAASAPAAATAEPVVALPVDETAEEKPAAPRATPRAAPPSPRSPTAKRDEPREPSGLAAELAILDAARAALAQRQADRALTELAAYERAFPRGSTRLEASVLRVEALAQAGRESEAATLGRELLADDASLPYRARLRRALGGAR